MSLPASYCTVADVLACYPSIGSVAVISSAQIAEAIGAEQVKVEAKLAERYAIPFGPCPPLIQSITADLATYRIISTRRLLPEDQDAKDWLNSFKQSADLLDRLSRGTLGLPTGSGTLLEQNGPAAGALYHNAMGDPIFTGQPFEQVDIPAGPPARDWNR